MYKNWFRKKKKKSQIAWLFVIKFYLSPGFFKVVKLEGLSIKTNKRHKGILLVIFSQKYCTCS